MAKPITPEIEPLPLSRKEAIRIKVKFYFTHNKCKRGHLAKRYFYNGSCIECYKIERIKHRATDKCKQTTNAHYKRNKIRILAKQKLLRYNITIEEYNKFLINQENCCAICRKPFNKEIQNDIQIDHCHTTKIVRGILCLQCNLGLGYFKDNISYLKLAIKYLERSK